METKKYDLYKEYADICLTEEQYNAVVASGILPSDYSQCFEGNYHRDYCSGKFIDRIANLKGLRLMLNNWGGCSYRKQSAFLFDDFIVIVQEPEGYESFAEMPDILPIAIPISTIDSFEISKEKIILISKTYTKRSKYGYVFQADFCVQYYCGKPVGVNNFSYHVNRILLDVKKEVLNIKGELFEKINSRISEILTNCNRDFDDRERIIENIADSTRVTSELRRGKFLSAKEFVEILADNKEFLSSKCPDMIGILENTEQKKKTISEEKHIKITTLQGALVEAQKELESTNFFKKGKIKSKIEEIQGEIEQAKNEVCNISLSDNEYRSIIEQLVSAIDSGKCTHNYSANEIKLAKELYVECNKRGITKINTPEEQQVFKMLCSKMNIPVELQNANFLFAGCTKENTSKRKFNQGDRIRLQIRYNTAKENAEKIGTIKYIAGNIEKLKAAEGNSKAAELLANMAETQSKTRAVTHDSAILGGIANGLGGPIAGAATYAKTEMENAAAKERAEEVRIEAKKNRSLATSYQRAFAKEAAQIAYSIERVQSKLIDLDNPMMYFPYIKHEIKGYTINSGAMELIVEAGLEEDAKIGNMDIAIDGSLKIDVIKDGLKVGDAYLCTRGFDEMDLNYVGFKTDRFGKRERYTIVALPIYGDFEENQEYTFNVLPYHVWMIEK